MLRVENVSREFEETGAVRNVDLEVAQGEIVCLLGPSGCGKTTLLHIIAGLDETYTGDVLLDGKSIKHVSAHKNDFGLMFQDFALFPHMTVAKNIMFGLRMQGMEPTHREERLRDVLTLVGLLGYEDREVTQLSGGERQRVALARSLAPRPRLLMLDEPLGSLDAALRKRLIVELRGIIKRVGLTTIYVTHDQEEAFVMGDRLVIMNDGRIEQMGTPEMVYRRPQTEFVAHFLGLENILSVQDWQNGELLTLIGQVPCDRYVERILIHPAGIRLDQQSQTDTIQARVKERIFNGKSYELIVEISNNVDLRFSVSAFQDYSPEVNDQIQLSIIPSAIVPLT